MSATYEKNLRTGRSFWQSRRLTRIETRTLRRDAEADVLIVGAGISGAMTAEALSEVGLRIIIVDRRGALKGSTLASTALLQYEIDVPLSKLAKRIGRDRAERIWRRSHLALCALRERARRLDIKADLINRDSLICKATNSTPMGYGQKPRRAVARDSRSPISRQGKSKRASAFPAARRFSVSTICRPIRDAWRQDF